MSHTPPEFEFEGTTTRATGLADMATPLERELFAKVAALTAERDRMAAVVEAARAYRNKAKPDDVKSYEYHAWQLDSNDLLTALAALDTEGGEG